MPVSRAIKILNMLSINGHLVVKSTDCSIISVTAMNTDIVPPAPEAAPPAAAASETPPAAVKAAEPAADKTQKAGTPPAPKSPQPGSGVGAAIAATVVIVLGLGLLATYAYLQSR